MTPVRLVPYLAGAALVVAGAALLIDTLVVTEEEELDRFVAALTSDGVRAALVYADPSRVPVEVVSREGARTFDDGTEVDLADRTHALLGGVAGRSGRLVSKAIEIRGDRALVAVRLASAGELVDAQFRFVRRPDGWRLSRVRLL